MSAKDFFHHTVRLALEKDGWLITDDPLSFTVDSLEFTIDLGAEKEGQKIAVKIKNLF